MKCFITVWNRHSWLIPFCEDLVRCRVEPVLIDNHSTYQPCIDWLKSCPYHVEWREQNHGPWAFFITDLYKKYTDRFFMISDSDQCIKDVPEDFPSVLLGGLALHDYDKIWKCGLSQECEDLPNHPTLNKIKEYERGFWANKTKHGFYHTDMDLGIAVYDRSRRTENPTNTDENGHGWYNAIRADRPYTSRHLDWYLTKETLRPEDEYYFTNKEMAYYGWGFEWFDTTFNYKR